MRPTKTYDAQAADLVTRTLALVAEATDVADEERAWGSDAVVRLDTPAPSPGRRRRRRVVRAAVGLTASVAAAVAALVIVRDDSSDVTTGPAGDADSPPVAVPHTRWVPDGLVETQGPQPVGEIDLEIDAVVVGVPGGGEVLVAMVTHVGGRSVERYEADWVVDRLTGLFATPDDEAVVKIAEGDPRAFVAVPRGNLASQEVDAVVAYMATVASFEAGDQPPDGPDGITVVPVSIDWAPGLAPTRAQAFSREDGAFLEADFVAGELPDERELDLLLGGVDPQHVGDGPGWRWRSESSDQEMVLWQEAPGTIGAVVAGGLSPDEVVRAAESVEAELASPDSVVWEVGRSNEGSDIDYRVEWAARWPEQNDEPCAWLVVADVRAPSACGVEHPGTTFEAGPVAGRNGVDVYWGIIPPSISTVELHARDGGRLAVAEALPLDRGDPQSLRYVVLTAPSAPAGEIVFRNFDADGRAVEF